MFVSELTYLLSPAGINAATTWDKKLIYNRGKAIGQENRGKGVNIALGPMMNMGRVAAGGRNWEGFGSDPYLTGEAAVQTILGLQSVGVQGNAKVSAIITTLSFEATWLIHFSALHRQRAGALPRWFAGRADSVLQH
jgi:hypothetical protein